MYPAIYNRQETTACRLSGEIPNSAFNDNLCKVRNFIASFYTMAILTPMLKRGFFVLIFVSFAQDAAAHKAVNLGTKTQKSTAQVSKNAPSSSAEPVPVVRDFDKLRIFQSYDPATGKWSTIEGFETVNILEDTTVQREDRYIYHSFWAYDAVTDCWYKVDIRDHGYRLGKLAATESTEAATVPQKSSRFWKNFALGLSVGAGPTLYQSKIAHCSITERDGVFFLQTAPGKQDKKSYQINWFGAGYTECGDPEAGSQGKLGIRKTDIGKKIVFRGIGWNIPIKLFTHYTFFKRLRIGAGCELEINHLKELTPKENASSLKPFKVKLDHEWFYNIAWFGLMGFKVIHEPHQDVIVDLQVGRNYNAGATLNHLFGGKGHLYDGWLLGAGVAYERRLNNYFRFLTRLSGDWKIHDDTPSSIADAQASVKLHQVAFHLDLGIQVSFGKDPEEDKRTEELGADHDSVSARDSAEARKNQRQAAAKKLSNTKDRRKRLGSNLRKNTVR